MHFDGGFATLPHMADWDQTVTLPDGRTLGFAEYGDPTGDPLFAFHGNLSSRLEIDFADQAATTAGFRIISPDRPGMGLSTFQPRRTLLDFPADVTYLADHLGVETFAVYGFSAGSTYALACSYALGQRVRAVAAVGAAKPYNTFGSRQGMPRSDRLMLVLARYARPVFRLVVKQSVISADDDTLFNTLVNDLCPADVDYVTSLGVPAATNYLRESVRSGPQGVVWDFKVLAERWGFHLSDVSAPVDVWHGTQDMTGTPDEQQVLVDGLPNVMLHTVNGEGHVSVGPACIDQILTTLRSRSTARL